MKKKFLPQYWVYYLLTFLFVFNYSCKKIETNDAESKDNPMQIDGGGGGGTVSCRDELEPDWYLDSVATQTILGAQLNGNPYSVSNMQQASVNLYGHSHGIVANRKYVRFRPMDEEQTQTLQESELSLFDYPLDREVIEEGDYYLQPGMSPEDFPWLYSVVNIGYQPPADITYEVLQELYVPDMDIWLEDEALRITGNPVVDSCNGSIYRLPQPCDDPCNPGPGCPLPPPNCGGGDPIPPPDIKIPAGLIEVWDSNFNDDVPVRRTRVVARRWFKIDLAYTNDQGQFRCTKRFRNKVNIFVKFINNHIRVSRLIGNPVTRSLFPIKRGIGIYSGNLSNIHYVFERGNTVFSRRYRHWWAAQLMNAYLEYNQMAAERTIGQLSFGGRLRVALTSFSFLQGGGATPMNSHRVFSGYPTWDYIKYYFSNPITTQGTFLYNALANGLLFRFMDMGLGFRTDVLWASNQVKDLMYHEMTHAAHFVKAGEFWWNDFVYSESFTITKHLFAPANQPYGLGDDGTISDIISIGESWAEHVAQEFSNQQYGFLNGPVKVKQGITYTFNSPVTGLGAHFNAIEDFSPNRTNDVFRWIPEGIYNDMIDNRNDFVVYSGPIDDNVVGYTNEQLFQSLDPDVKSMPQYMNRLLSENGNNQFAQVFLLFNQYHY